MATSSALLLADAENSERYLSQLLSSAGPVFTNDNRAIDLGRSEGRIRTLIQELGNYGIGEAADYMAIAIAQLTVLRHVALRLSNQLRQEREQVRQSVQFKFVRWCSEVEAFQANVVDVLVALEAGQPENGRAMGAFHVGRAATVGGASLIADLRGEPGLGGVGELGSLIENLAALAERFLPGGSEKATESIMRTLGI